ncbi:MAG TPA: hypothetical protein VOA88_15755 [Candidatus Dormibacteraeota bacterium]|nr:hypothetical protein [Candidatus Dormibacteraeota bacterium]
MRKLSEALAGKFRGFEKKDRQKVLSLLAAALVIALFIVRDGFRERSKALADAIDAAEATYEQRTFNRVLLHDVKTVGQAVDEVAAGVEDIQNYQLGYRRIDWRQMPEVKNTPEFVLDSDTADVESVFEEIKWLTRHSGVTAEEQSSLTDFHKRFESIKHERDAIVPPTDTNRDLLIKHVLTNSALYQRTVDALKSLKGNIDATLAKMVQEAEVKRDRNERLYIAFTTLMYILFGLGWLVGLAGVILGVKVEQGE